jgi:hypothetical protein
VDPVEHGSEIFKHYLDHFDDYSDILKEVFAHLKTVNLEKLGQMLSLALKRKFEDSIMETDG